MKKIISLSVTLSLLLSASAMTVFSEDKPEPAELPECIYQQLLEKGNTDADKDGIITEEEYCNSTYLSLDLTDVESIEFLGRLKNPRYIYLSKGKISDFSLLAKYKDLETLQLSEMPQITDISFAKDMNLLKFYIIDLEQITDEQKIEVMKFHDAETSEGFTDMIGATPTGMFTYDKIALEIADTDIAGFDTMSRNPALTSSAYVYGKSAGSTEYTVKLNDKLLHKGKINVTGTTPETLPASPEQNEPKIIDSEYYSEADNVVLQNGTLYRLADGKMITVAEKVADFDKDYTYDETGDFITIETILYNDSTIEVNGAKIADTADLKFTTIGRGLCVTDKGEVYSVIRKNGHFTIDLIYKGFGGFLENSSMNFISDTGEVIQIELKKNDGTTIGYQAFPTGITDVVSSYNQFFIDKNKDLWKINRRVGGEPTTVKCGEDVEFVGYRYYNGGSTYGCVHITSDGTAYNAGTPIKVALSDNTTDKSDYKAAGRYTLDFNYDQVTGSVASTGPQNTYHITNDDTLCMEYEENKAAVADVKEYIAARRSEDGKSIYVYFLKNDNTIWAYSFGAKKTAKVSADSSTLAEPAKVRGDVNSDGRFDVSDAVLLQKWLLAEQDAVLKDWEAADLCKDNVLDVFDLCILKKELLSADTKK